MILGVPGQIRARRRPPGPGAWPAGGSPASVGSIGWKPTPATQSAGALVARPISRRPTGGSRFRVADAGFSTGGVRGGRACIGAGIGGSHRLETDACYPKCWRTGCDRSGASQPAAGRVRHRPASVGGIGWKPTPATPKCWRTGVRQIMGVQPAGAGFVGQTPGFQPAVGPVGGGAASRQHRLRATKGGARLPDKSSAPNRRQAGESPASVGGIGWKPTPATQSAGALVVADRIVGASQPAGAGFVWQTPGFQPAVERAGERAAGGTAQHRLETDACYPKCWRTGRADKYIGAVATGGPVCVADAGFSTGGRAESGSWAASVGNRRLLHKVLAHWFVRPIVGVQPAAAGFVWQTPGFQPASSRADATPGACCLEGRGRRGNRRHR